jgi:hypothetical protein
VIVGYVSDRFDGFPVAFIDDGVMRPLLPGGACCSVPAAIDDRGDVVGTLDGTHAFLLEDGVLTRLGDLPAVRAAGRACCPRPSTIAAGSSAWASRAHPCRKAACPGAPSC